MRKWRRQLHEYDKSSADKKSSSFKASREDKKDEEVEEEIEINLEDEESQFLKDLEEI